MLTPMHLSDFDYHLPAELIAQRPPSVRDGGRLMRLDRAREGVTHHQVTDLPRLLPPRCLLVVNDTRVIPARVLCQRETGGKVELLLLEQLDASSELGRAMLSPALQQREIWWCMARASKTLRQGEQLLLGDAPDDASPRVTVLTRPASGRCLLAASPGLPASHGAVPLPPYIRRPADEDDSHRYQTVYARDAGSVAAPTAGLHFTRALLRQVRAAGVEQASVTLHVGPGTFVPVRTDEVDDHRMEEERYEVSEATARAIAEARRQGRAVVAVGTTVVRTLESTGGEAGSGRTDLFIRPGHEFAAVDALLTNFHLPGSTLLMLVAALTGRERMLAAYEEAVRQRYRFYSYGDAMLILGGER